MKDLSHLLTRQFRTMDGRYARIICTTVRNDDFPLAVLVEDAKGKEHVELYTADLKYYINNYGMDNRYDLVDVTRSVRLLTYNN